MQLSVSHQNQEKQNALEELNQQIKACTSCRLSATREHALVGEGIPKPV